MSNTKTFQFDNGSSPFDADTELVEYGNDAYSVRVAGRSYLDELIESKSAVLTVFKDGNVVLGQLTTGGCGEIAMPVSMETRGKCSCGDPAPSNAGTEIVTGGPSAAAPESVTEVDRAMALLRGITPEQAAAQRRVLATVRALKADHPECFADCSAQSPEVMAARVGDMAKAMGEIDLFPIVPNSQSDRDFFWTVANAEGWKHGQDASAVTLAARAGEVADAMDEARSAMDVALDGEPDAAEPPTPREEKTIRRCGDCAKGDNCTIYDALLDSDWSCPAWVHKQEEPSPILDVAEDLDRRPVEPPKPAELLPTVSEPNTAPVGVSVAPEEPSGICLTAAVRKVPLGAAVNQ